MRLVQFSLPGEGRRIGVIEKDLVFDITAKRDGVTTMLGLLGLAASQRANLAALVVSLRDRSPKKKGIRWADLDGPVEEGRPHLLPPVDPPEVWGCGITYKRSAEFRDQDTGKPRGIYDYVYESDRPEVFFKATAARCVGPRDAVGVRSDSKLTAAEPELAVVLGSDGAVLGYTICNDVSAWDIERENPLFLPQSKIFRGCCALGPSLVTPVEVRDPHQLDIQCTIRRDGVILFEGSCNTRQMRRKIDELVAALQKDNPIPFGTVLATGTGIMVPNEAALKTGDEVEIEIEGLGRLVNAVRQL